ncbi:MAG: alpha/beta hydrolase [Candidatus Aminicenantes bacterium]
MTLSDKKKTLIKRTPPVKKRKPLLSAALSLVSLGLGQIYNGELLKGLLLKSTLLVSIVLYSILVFKTSHELFLLLAFVIVFLLSRIYSIVQAFFKSRRLDTAYTLRKFNRSYIYVILTVIFIAFHIVSILLIPRLALLEQTTYHPFRSAGAKEHYIRFYETRAKSWPVDSETRMVETTYGQTFVRISGRDEAPPLVLLPGANATSLLWIPNIKALSAFYRTYALDNIYDVGRSVFTRKLKEPEDFVHWLDELFTKLGLEDNIRLMGLSYGGWITSQYALHTPERLKKIVMLAPAATVKPLGPVFLKSALLCLIPHRHFVRKSMEMVMGDLAHKKDKDSRQQFENIMKNAFLGLRCFKPKMLVSPTVLSEKEWQNLKVPALYLVGENERIYAASGYEAIQHLQKVAPHVKTELIPDAGHDLTVIQADMVNRIILEFLKDQ